MKIIESQDTYTVITPRYGKNSDVEIRDFPKKRPTLRAQIATEMVGKWAMFAGDQDGEDSAGRAKVRNMEPAEVVNRAVATADLLVGEFEARGWLVPGIHPSQVYGGEEE